MFSNLIKYAQSRFPFDSKRIGNSLNNANRQRRIERHDDESVWCVEPLERRQMLAGDVSAVLTNAGTLRITGTNDANQVIITSNGAGKIKVVGKPGTGTTVNGAPELTFLQTIGSAINRDLIINMRGGDDFVEVDEVIVSRNTRLNLGSGNDTVGMFDTSALNNLVVSLGTGDDLAGFSRMTVSNNTRVVGGSGSDTVAVAQCLNFVGRVTINTGSGDDGVLLQGDFDEPVVVSTGTGNDLVRVNRVVVRTTMRFQLGGGDDEIAVGSDWILIGATGFTAVGGAGFDTFASEPAAPGFTERTIESSFNSNADITVDEAVLAVSLSYILRGGDPSDLPCS